MWPAPPKLPSHPPIEIKTSTTKPKTRRVLAPPDGGYGWVIVGAAFCSYTLSMVTMANFGVFLVELVEHFQTQNVVLGWVGALQLSCNGLVGLILGPLVRRYGCRVVCIAGALLVAASYAVTFTGPSLPFLFVTFGALPGAGIGCLFITSNVSVQQYFSSRRSLAVSVAVTGTAVGMFVFPQLTRLLIDTYAWQGAVLIYGALMLNGIAVGLLLKPVPTITIIEPPDIIATTERSPVGSDIIFASTEMIAVTGSAHFTNIDRHTDDKTHKCTCVCRYTKICAVRRNLPEIAIIIGYFLLHCGHQSFIALQPARAAYLGFDKSQGALVVSVYGVMTGLFRIPAGWLGDRPSANRVILCGSGGMVAAGCTVGSFFIRDYMMLLVYAGFYGLATALYFGLLSVAVIDVFGISRIQTGACAQQVTGGLAVIFMLPVSGWIMDVTGNPNIPLLVFAICQFIGGALFLTVPFMQKLLRNETRDRKSSNIRLIEENRQAMLSKRGNAEFLESTRPKKLAENRHLVVPKA